MKIFVAGSTGVIGRNLLPMLIGKGWEVYALVRSEQKIKDVEAQGAKAVLANVLDKNQLIDVITQVKPEVIIHQLTALSGVSGNFNKLDEEFELTNRFRTEVTDFLIEAAKLSGTQRFIAQSFCGWPFERKGSPIKTEKDPFDLDPPASIRKTLQAIVYLEDSIKSVKDFEALALRFGLLYGPGTGFSKDTPIIKLIQKRKLPVVGTGDGIWSFIHIVDAANATLNAITNGNPGIYNIVDDEPAPVKTWLPYLADVLNAKQPAKVPSWFARFLIGEAGISMMTKIRGGSNEKAKHELLWKPHYSTWRQGFKEVLS